MHTKRIIPCLDVKGGRVVKGVNFVDLKDAGDPVEIGKAYDEAGADELVFHGYHSFLRRQGYGGGYGPQGGGDRLYPLHGWGRHPHGGGFPGAAFGRGADKISINSSAIQTPELICAAADKFGSQCVVVAIDAKRRADGSGWNIYKNGGRVDMGIDALEWAVKAEKLEPGKSF